MSPTHVVDGFSSPVAVRGYSEPPSASVSAVVIAGHAGNVRTVCETDVECVTSSSFDDVYLKSAVSRDGDGAAEGRNDAKSSSHRHRPVHQRGRRKLMDARRTPSGRAVRVRGVAYTFVRDPKPYSRRRSGAVVPALSNRVRVRAASCDVLAIGELTFESSNRALFRTVIR